MDDQHEHKAAFAATLYLAGPIDQVGSKQDGGEAPSIESWKTDLLALLSHLPIVAFDPYLAYKLNGHRDIHLSHYMCKVNEAAYKNADIVVAYLPKGIPTIGTTMELVESVGHKVVFIITEFQAGESISLDGLIQRGLEDVTSEQALQAMIAHARFSPNVHPIRLKPNLPKDAAWREALASIHDIISLKMGGSRDNDVAPVNPLADMG